MFRVVAAAAVVAAAVGFPAVGVIAGHSGVSKPFACSPGTYRNSSGNCVEDPDGNKNGTAVCRDGTESHSESRSGTCSGHGGVQRWSDWNQGASGSPDFVSA
jgi:hypothetical protein